MSVEGRTGLVLPVPAADDLLGRIAARWPAAARPGVPAHISLLYPFLPLPSVDEEVVRVLSDLFAPTPAPAVEFGRCHRAEGFLSVRPAPVHALVDLTGRVRRRWPDLLPYGGAYGQRVEPHRTVAMGVPESERDDIERVVEAELPFTTRLAEAWLVAFTDRWGLRARFPFRR